MARVLQRSFGGGEIAPEMFGRIDLNHYQTGLATCLNAYPLPAGPVVNRQGWQFVKEVKDGGATTTRIIAFIFNTEQAYALEFGDQYLRVHTEGGTVLEAGKTISGATQAHPCQITATAHGYANGDEVYHLGIAGMTQLNGRYFKIKNATANTYEITDLKDNAIDSTGFTVYSSGGTAARVYTLTTPYVAADIMDLIYTQSADVMTLTHPAYAPREVQRLGATNWQIQTISFAPSIDAPAGVGASASPASGSDVSKYVVTAVKKDNLEESIASSEVLATNDLSIEGNKNTVSWDAVTDAARYNVYKDDNNGVHGYIGQTPDLQFIDDNIDPDLLTSPPENQDPFTGAGDYPSTVSYHDQRRVFSATDNNPQTNWMSRGGTESNLSKSIPSQDNDAIQFSLASRQFNRIRNLVSLDDLLIFTSAAEWKLYTQNSDALTPTTIGLRPQSYVGSNRLTPLVAGDSILFVANLGGHVYDMNYSFETDKYRPRDISIVAPHLFDGYTISDWDYTSVPYPMSLAVRSDGKMVGLTYLSGQKPDVLGWHLHDTDGRFESVCVIPESSGEEMAYAVIRRRVNGITRRYIERLHSRLFTDIRDAFHVDSGLSYDNPKTITGATKANPVVITSPAHGFDNEDVIQITDVEGYGTDIGMTELNRNRYTVRNRTTDTFELYTTAASPVAVDGSAYNAYISGGKARKEITVISGLWHLIGESVAIFADGSVHPKQTVSSSGRITLTQAAARVHIGLSYKTDIKTLPPVFAQDEAVGQARFLSPTKVYLNVQKARGIFAGPDFEHLSEFAQRRSEPYNAPTNMTTDEIEILLNSSWGRQGQIAIRQTDPVPISILSLVWEGAVGD